MDWKKITENIRSKESRVLFFIALVFASDALFFVLPKIEGRYAVFGPSFSLAVFTLVASAATLYLYLKSHGAAITFLKRLAITWAPSQAIMMIGMEMASCDVAVQRCVSLSYILPLVAIAYFSLLAYLIVRPIRTEEEGGVKGLMKKSRPIMTITILVLAMAMGLSFGLYRISEKAAVDESLWTFGRIQKYWNNLADGEIEKTLVNDKPGITVALLGGIGLLKVDPLDRASTYWNKEPNTLQKIEERKTINRSFRSPFLFLAVLSVPLIYWLLRKIIDRTSAIFAVFAISLSPLLLGISTIVNPDSILWIFSLSAFLCFIIYLQKDLRPFLYLAGIFLGLALLTKYVANIFFVFFPLLIFLEYTFNRERYKDALVVDHLKSWMKDYLIVVYFSLFVFYIFLPAAWEKPSLILRATLSSQAFQKVWPVFLTALILICADLFIHRGKLMFLIAGFFSKQEKKIKKIVPFVFLSSTIIVLANLYLDLNWFDFESLLASPKTSHSLGSYFGMILADIYSQIFGIHPLLFFGLVFLLIKNIIRPTRYSDLATYILSFIIIYFIASTINDVSATIRYQIILFPLILILAAMGIVEFLNMEKIRRFINPLLILPLLVLALVLSLNDIKPFYFSYASGLLPEKYVLNPKDMGDGSYEAAMYLNSLRSPKTISIWSDKDGVCDFFLGKCDIERDPESIDSFDYLVISSGRQNRTSRLIRERMEKGKVYPFRIDKLYLNDDDELYKLEIGGRPDNYVKIFPASAVEKYTK